jgi:aminoacrylate hydrolase
MQMIHQTEEERVSRRLREQLQHFRRTHEYRYLDVAGIRWRYLRTGQGEETILLLPGAPGICETSFQQILALERTCCVLAVVYPSAATTMARITEGLQAILAAERINRVHVLGTSYGGAISQCLFLLIPQKIGRLVFICSGTPQKSVLLKYWLCYCLLALLPAHWIHLLLLWRKPSFLSGLRTERAFWSAYYDQMIPSLSKQDYLARLRVWIDFHQHAPASLPAGATSPEQVLIIAASNDTVFSCAQQQSLQTLYPRARVYRCPQATHMAAISNIDEYFATVLRFFYEDPGTESAAG